MVRLHVHPLARRNNFSNVPSDMIKEAISTECWRDGLIGDWKEFLIKGILEECNLTERPPLYLENGEPCFPYWTSDEAAAEWKIFNAFYPVLVPPNYTDGEYDSNSLKKDVKKTKEVILFTAE